MDYSITANELLKKLGGDSNIISVTHCMTRMRFVLIDESIVDDKTVEAIPGVMGIMKKGGQYQVIIGNNVTKCYDAFMQLGNFGEDRVVAGKKVKKKITFGTIINGILDTIAGTMAPILPGIIGGGMLKLLLVILELCGVSETGSSYLIISYIADAPFYFLPVLIAYSAAKKFKCNPILAVSVAAMLIYPNFITMLGGEPVKFLGIPVFATTYSSSVIPALLSTWVLKYVEKGVDKITPSFTKTILKPAIVLLVMAPITFLVLGPIGGIIGEGLSKAIFWLQSRANWLTLMIAGAIMPLLVMTGMHYAFMPTAIQDFATLGCEAFLIPSMLCSNIAQGAAAFAVAIKTKDKELKGVATAAAASALFGGITEPALYGVTLKLKKPMIAAIIGGGVSGLFAGIMNIKGYAMTSPCLVGLLGFVSPDKMNLVYACITAAISVVVTFVLTLVLGWKEVSNAIENVEKNAENKDEKKELVVEDLYSPINGTVVALDKVNDETFAKGILGKGFAVMPSEGAVYAPFDGKVETLFETLHALGLTSKDGVELLVHVGLETVALKGEGFKALVKEGDEFKKGDKLLEFDIEAIKKAGYEVVTPVIITNHEIYQDMTVVDADKQVSNDTVAVTFEMKVEEKVENVAAEVVAQKEV